MTLSALSSDQVKNLSLGGTIAVVVIGLILLIVVKAVVGRIITVVVVVGLAVVLWTQRTQIQDRVNKCNPNLSFLGAHVQLSQSVLDKCKQVTSR